ncbi:MAG: hypothetical protein M3286_01530 [Thermoproteota archaeon]|nr:hypothetical protein [Thermoproteota archaeon]
MVRKTRAGNFDKKKKKKKKNVTSGSGISTPQMIMLRLGVTKLTENIYRARTT